MKIICVGLLKMGIIFIVSVLKMFGFNVYDFWEYEVIYGNEWFDLYLKGKKLDFIFMY